jgi:predicted metal-dependent hydrolase
MSASNNPIHLLEINVQKLIEQHQLNLTKVKLLRQELEEALEENKRLTSRLDHLSAENRSLKTANAMLGSTEYKRETKLKINSLIREIDQCIIQLSE